MEERVTWKPAENEGTLNNGSEEEKNRLAKAQRVTAIENWNGKIKIFESFFNKLLEQEIPENLEDSIDNNYANKINKFIATFYELIFEGTPLFSADTDLKNSFPGLTDETKTFLIKFNQLTEENRPQFLKKQKLNANSDQMKKIIAFLRKEIGKD